ncbi:MAG: glyoxalase/bleomycin resistance/extradiol dioxygenase family protein [Bacteroidia bacterium]|nr:glyoxalase/bleomycin resistance/extradiol dioxygenase family protein [Bacteroidia bacterium]
MSELLKTKFLHLSPVMASSNVSNDIEWYESKLGFKNVYDSSVYQEGDIDYAVLGRQNLFVHLQYQYPKDMTSTDVRIQVKNIDPLFEEYVAKEVIPADRMRRKTAWHTDEFGLFDPSGNRITFFEDL